MADSTFVLIRNAGGDWRVPSISSYQNERELQDILIAAPSLIPGVGEAVCVDELTIPGSGALDLFAIGPDGAMTLVECKLSSNAEVRRSVVGQIASYAAGLWGMSYDDLDQAFRARSGQHLIEAVEAISEGESDPEAFRRAVTDGLAHGQFRLVIAVDSITDELKRIIEYLNSVTTAEVEVLALEIGYVAEGSTEILLPVTHGAESVRLKGSSKMSRNRWTVDQVFARLEELTTDDALQQIRLLQEQLATNGAYWQPGTSSYPTMSLYAPIGAERRLRSVLAVYADPSGPNAPRVSVNLGSLVKDLDEDDVEAIVKAIEHAPPLEPHMKKVWQDGFNTYPAIPLTDFGAAGAGEILARCLLPHVADSG